MAPAAIVVAPGEAVPQVAAALPVIVVKRGVTVTSVAAAPPAAFRTFAVSVTDWPALRGVGGWDAKLTVSAAAAWIVVGGDVVTVPLSTVPVPAAVPLAVAVNVIVPAPFTVQVNV